MKHYELFYVIPGSYTEEEADNIGKKINEIVKKYGGHLVHFFYLKSD